MNRYWAYTDIQVKGDPSVIIVCTKRLQIAVSDLKPIKLDLLHNHTRQAMHVARCLCKCAHVYVGAAMGDSKLPVRDQS